LATPYILRSLGKANIFFDVEPETYVQWSWAIMEYVLSNTHSGSIILLHPMYAWTGNQSLEILDELIDKLKQKGFSFVTIDELLKQSNTKISFR
jgi:peptidoglycan/xylan/chitin deacetylase (PgdA/CDA1 family)